MQFLTVGLSKKQIVIKSTVFSLLKEIEVESCKQARPHHYDVYASQHIKDINTNAK